MMDDDERDSFERSQRAPSLQIQFLSFFLHTLHLVLLILPLVFLLPPLTLKSQRKR